LWHCCKIVKANYRSFYLFLVAISINLLLGGWAKARAELAVLLYSSATKV
jgi:hypothetical protein